MILSRKQKEVLVIKLANEGKTTRDIAKEAHVSLKDIGSIIRKYTGDENVEAYGMESLKKHSLESKAFQMFKEGRSNVDVAITLNIPASDVLDYQQDYQRLLNFDDFIQFYSDLGNDLQLLVFFYKRMKSEGLLNKKEIQNLVCVECELKELAYKIDRECQEISRLNIIKLQLIDQIKTMGGVI